MIEWIESRDVAFWWLLATSAIFFVVTLVGAPLLVIRIPSNYFSDGRQQREPGKNLPSSVRPIFKVGKNVLGVLLLVAGVAMLVLPGQGVFAILIGLALLDVPGKRRALRWIVSRPSVLRSINKLRRRHGRPPLIFGT
jgi:hypothetical protein